MKLKTLALIAASSVISVSAYAQTEYNLTISNTAKLSYTSGTDPRTTESNEETFKVDRKVTFNLSGTNTDRTVTPGETNYSTYILSNTSNAPIDYSISAPSSASPFTVKYYIEDGTIPGGLDVNDTEISSSIALAAYDGITAVTETIYVEIVTGASAVDTNSQLYTLTATAVEPATGNVGAIGTNIVPTLATAIWTKDIVQTVVDNSAGTANNQGILRTETGTYTVGAAIIALEKSVQILSDPITNPGGIATPSGQFPKAIPGAVVEYTLTIRNTGHAPATVQLTDLLSDNFDQSGTIASSEIDGTGPAPGASLVAALPAEVLLGFDQLLTIPSVTVIAVPANDTPPEQTTVVTFEVVLK